MEEQKPTTQINFAINLDTKTVVTTTATVVATVFVMKVAAGVVTPPLRRLVQKLENHKNKL